MIKLSPESRPEAGEGKRDVSQSRERFESGRPARVKVGGEEMWPRLLDVVRTGDCEVAVDPGEKHGVRITREMILGMANTYGRRKDS